MKEKPRIHPVRGFRTSVPWPATDLWERQPSRRRRAALLLALIVVVAAGAIILALRARSAAPPPPPTPPLVERLDACAAPPGAALAFTQFEDRTLYRLDAGTTIPQPLTEAPDWPRYPVWSPEGDRVSVRSGDMLAVIEAAGGALRDLMAFPPGAGWWDWSPDGRYIAIQGHSADEPTRWTLYSVEAATHAVVTLAHHQSDKAIWWNWSPEGHRLVFATHEEGITRVNVAEADGSALATLRADGGFDPRPEWTPDGHSVVAYNEAADALDVLDAQSGALQQQIPGRWALLSHDEHQSPWSPDGRYLAYRVAGDIVARRWEDGANVQLTRSAEDDTFLGWSPDSARVLFSSSVDGQPGLFTANVATGRTVRLFDAPVTDATWSPDGQWVAFGGASNVYAVASDGTHSMRLAENPGAYQAAWSPDSHHLAFRSAPGAVLLLEIHEGHACTLGQQVTDFAWQPAADGG